MCRMVFDTLSKSGIDKTTLGKADRVTFEYYSGRYELHNLKFRRAREHLLFAFDHCHINARKQQRSRPNLPCPQLVLYALSVRFL